MHVNIDQARASHEAGAIDDFGFFLFRRGEALNEHPVFHEEITFGIPIVGGINYTGVFDMEKWHGKLFGEFEGRVGRCRGSGDPRENGPEEKENDKEQQNQNEEELGRYLVMLTYSGWPPAQR